MSSITHIVQFVEAVLMIAGKLHSALCLLLCLSFTSSFAQTNESDLKTHGKAVFIAAGCAACHTQTTDDALPLAGGLAFETPFGIFYSPNISSHKEHGIGSWSADDLWLALTQGEGPSGTHYYPVFPFPSYAGITRRDSDALHQYLMSVEAHDVPNREHDLPWIMSWRFTNQVWKWMFFEPQAFVANESKPEQWNRGAYLVTVLGHCAECHSPRSSLGVVDHDLHLGGNENGPEGDAVPSLRSDGEDGSLSEWGVDEIITYLESGEDPDFDFAGGAMVDVIDDNTSLLTDADREAIAEYLKDLPPLGAP